MTNLTIRELFLEEELRRADEENAILKRTLDSFLPGDTSASQDAIENDDKLRDIIANLEAIVRVLLKEVRSIVSELHAFRT